MIHETIALSGKQRGIIAGEILALQSPSKTRFGPKSLCICVVCVPLKGTAWNSEEVDIPLAASLDCP